MIVQTCRPAGAPGGFEPLPTGRRQRAAEQSRLERDGFCGCSKPPGVLLDACEQQRWHAFKSRQMNMFTCSASMAQQAASLLHCSPSDASCQPSRTG